LTQQVIIICKGRTLGRQTVKATVENSGSNEHMEVGKERWDLGASNEDQMVTKFDILTVFVQCSFSACSVIIQWTLKEYWLITV